MNNPNFTKREIINGKLKCSNCKLYKDTINFSTDNSTSSSFRSNCKKCRKETRTDTKKYESNIEGIIGMFRNQCPCCSKFYSTKNPIQIYCSVKCTKRDWYLKNKGKCKREIK